MTGYLKSVSIKKLRVVLEASNIHLLKSDDQFDLIFITGCYKVVTPHLTYIVSGSITISDKPTTIDGI